MKSIVKALVLLAVNLGLVSKTKIKEASELAYWKLKKRKEKELNNDHYKYFYIEHFGLSEAFYSGKKVLDVGCGPRGSLEWADMTIERVGLDPLADKYLKLGADAHKMTYVNAGSESIPFPDDYFDVVCSFNSIDHVEDLPTTCQEIRRVLRNGGTFLLIVDIHDEPTINEPQPIDWNFIKKNFSEWDLKEERHFEKSVDGIYQSIRNSIPFDHNNLKDRYGILSARLEKA